MRWKEGNKTIKKVMINSTETNQLEKKKVEKWQRESKKWCKNKRKQSKHGCIQSDKLNYNEGELCSAKQKNRAQISVHNFRNEFE